MHRPDHSTADPDAIIVGVPGYTEGDPLAIPAVPRTIVTADHVNDIGESLCRVVEGSGRALVKSDYNQVVDAVLGGIDKICATNFDHITVVSAAAAIASGNIGNDVAFIRVGASGLIQRSVNAGESWTAASAAGGYSGTFLSAIFHAGVFVIGGTNGEIQYSSDLGATWARTTLASPTNKAILSLASDGTNLYAVGAQVSTAFVSTATTPGGTWTTRTPPAGSVDLTGVACRPGLVVAVGQNSSFEGLYSYSVDNGVTWTVVTHVTPPARDVVYEPRSNRFIACSGNTSFGYEGNISATPSGSATSWSLALAATTNRTFEKLVACGNGFVACASRTTSATAILMTHVGPTLPASWKYFTPTIANAIGDMHYGHQYLMLGYGTATVSRSLAFGHRAL